MIKKGGDKKVEEWTHSRSGLQTTIYLRFTEFVATILQREFKAPNIAILRSQMADYCEHWITMKWYGIIEIEVDSHRDSYRNTPQGAKLEFACKRFWVSKSPAGEFFRCQWDVDPDHRKAKMENYGVSVGYGRRYGKDHDMLKIVGLPLKAPLELDRGNYLLDYTEELWTRFQGLITGIEAMQKTITSLVSSRAGIEQLLAGTGAQILLTQGER